MPTSRKSRFVNSLSLAMVLAICDERLVTVAQMRR